MKILSRLEYKNLRAYNVGPTSEPDLRLPKKIAPKGVENLSLIHLFRAIRVSVTNRGDDSAFR